MQTYRVEAIVSSERTLTIKGVPFHAGEKVEVTVRRRGRKQERRERYPLRGKPVRYVKPFESVAESEWEALR